MLLPFSSGWLARSFGTGLLRGSPPKARIHGVRDLEGECKTDGERLIVIKQATAQI